MAEHGTVAKLPVMPQLLAVSRLPEGDIDSDHAFRSCIWPY